MRRHDALGCGEGVGPRSKFGPFRYSNP